MKETYYIGLDVHKDTVAIASIKSGSRSEAIYHSTCGGSNAAVERALRKLAKQLGVKLQELKVCYEAGPTGFVLGRRLIQLGLVCELCSPSKKPALDEAVRDVCRARADAVDDLSRLGFI